MFEQLNAVFREVAHVSELTGISVGALIACAAVIYFWPPLRALAIQVAVVVAVAYVSGLYWGHVMASDVRAQWAAANEEAAKKADERDRVMSEALDAKYQPVIAGLQKQRSSLQEQVASYEKALLAAKSTSPTTGYCRLGAAALRLRNRQ